ncbi:peptidoglycan-binding domain-containing protein [Candidatus Thioglobus sp.]|uniref:peptidoglycan-binding domain-containing protein n=1 Tax=Candidatus Thioglobus sp. TaxID=2026721 RepID=UPI003D141B8D
MKKIVLLSAVSVVFVSLSTLSHQIKTEAGHASIWNWNQKSHTHDEVAPVVERAVVATPTSTIKGMKGLDGIAKVGECYVPAYVEASCTNETKKVLVQKAYTETAVVAAVTKQVERKVMIESAKVIEEYIPALYENVSKRVLVSEAHTAWRKGSSSSIQKVVDGDTHCLVNVPAVYETRVDKVLRIAASSKTRTVPAVYKTYMETIVVTPETTRVVKSHDAVYNTVQECVEKTAGAYQWRSILCAENATTSVLRSVEKALADKGHLSTSKVDGTIDGATESAIKAYQRSTGLAVDGLVNIETVKSLNVKY